jgi:hypothetical protein
MEKCVLNPNCSELVTHLEVTEYGDVLRRLGEIIEHCEGWTMCVIYEVHKKNPETNRMDWTGSFLFPINREILHEIVYVADGPHGIEIIIDGKKLFEKWAERLVYENEQYIYGVEGRIEKPIEVNHTIYGPDFGMGDGYSDENCLTFRLTQHCCENEFPIFRQIVNLFNSDVAPYDGGSDEDYRDWLQQNYPDDEGVNEDEEADDDLDEPDGENIHLDE